MTIPPVQRATVEGHQAPAMQFDDAASAAVEAAPTEVAHNDAARVVGLLRKLGGRAQLSEADLAPAIVSTQRLPDGELLMVLQVPCPNCGTYCDEDNNWGPRGCSDPDVPQYVKDVIKNMSRRAR